MSLADSMRDTLNGCVRCGHDVHILRSTYILPAALPLYFNRVAHRFLCRLYVECRFFMAAKKKKLPEYVLLNFKSYLH